MAPTIHGRAPAGAHDPDRVAGLLPVWLASLALSLVVWTFSAICGGLALLAAMGFDQAATRRDLWLCATLCASPALAAGLVGLGQRALHAVTGARASLLLSAVLTLSTVWMLALSTTRPDVPGLRQGATPVLMLLALVPLLGLTVYLAARRRARRRGSSTA